MPTQQPRTGQPSLPAHCVHVAAHDEVVLLCGMPGWGAMGCMLSACCQQQRRYKAAQQHVGARFKASSSLILCLPAVMCHYISPAIQNLLPCRQLHGLIRSIFSDIRNCCQLWVIGSGGCIFSSWLRWQCCCRQCHRHVRQRCSRDCGYRSLLCGMLRCLICVHRLRLKACEMSTASTFIRCSASHANAAVGADAVRCTPCMPSMMSQSSHQTSAPGWRLAALPERPPAL